MGAAASDPQDNGDVTCNIDTGDSVKVKQILDECTVKAVLDRGYEEHHSLDNAKLWLMVLACAFAMVAQFWPSPFPESRPLLGICCSSYFALSGILQLVVWFWERDAIMFTEDAMPATSGAKRASELGLRIRSSFPRFQDEYTLIIQLNKPEGTTPTTTETWSVGKFFDVDGNFWDIGYCEAVDKVLAKFEAKKYD